MSTRREPQSLQKKPSWESVGARVRQRAMSGTEASTVGFVLVLYVFAGAGLGYLADKYFETNWIVAAGVLAGSVVGFREMFRMIKQISRIEEKANENPDASHESQVAMPPEYSGAEKLDAPNAPTGSAQPVKRKTAFPIPPPPVASFDNPDNKPESPR